MNYESGWNRLSNSRWPNKMQELTIFSFFAADNDWTLYYDTSNGGRSSEGALSRSKIGCPETGSTDTDFGDFKGDFKFIHDTLRQQVSGRLVE